MLGKFIRRDDSTAYRTIDGVAMVVGAPDGVLRTLNKVGSFIWKQADGRHTLGEIVNQICQEFDVDYAQAARHAKVFVQELVGKNMLVVTDTPAKSEEKP